MTDLIPFESPIPSGHRPSRQTRRALAELVTGSRLSLARLEAIADNQAARADAVAFVGRRAMQDVAMLSQLEQQLVTMVPMASGRLAMIGDLTALAISEVVNDTLRLSR